jgi:hypothetical protein
MNMPITRRTRYPTTLVFLAERRAARSLLTDGSYSARYALARRISKRMVTAW